MEFLIPSRTSRPGDDPIFALNTEARARAAAGESIVNATVGALLDDEGRLAVIPTVVQRLLFPVLVAVGTLLGRYRKYADAPEPVYR